MSLLFPELDSPPASTTAPASTEYHEGDSEELINLSDISDDLFGGASNAPLFSGSDSTISTSAGAITNTMFNVNEHPSAAKTDISVSAVSSKSTTGDDIKSTVVSKVAAPVVNTDSEEFSWMKSGDDDLLLSQPLNTFDIPADVDMIPDAHVVENVPKPMPAAVEEISPIKPVAVQAHVTSHASAPVPTTHAPSPRAESSTTRQRMPVREPVMNTPAKTVTTVPATTPAATPAQGMPSSAIKPKHDIVVDPDESEVVLKPRKLKRRNSRIPMTPSSSLRRKYSRGSEPAMTPRRAFAEADTPMRPRRSIAGTPGKFGGNTPRRISSLKLVQGASHSPMTSGVKRPMSAMYDMKENSPHGVMAGEDDDDYASASKLRKPRTPSARSRHRSVLFAPR